jgi:hypothetical protein
MSSCDPSSFSFNELVGEINQRLADAVDEGPLSAIPDEQLGRLFGNAIRTLAAKAQEGIAPPPFGGNSSISPTDAVIACTAILDSVGLAVFELAAWQAVSNLGARTDARNSYPAE